MAIFAEGSRGDHARHDGVTNRGSLAPLARSALRGAGFRRRVGGDDLRPDTDQHVPGSRIQRHQDAQSGRQRAAVGRRTAADHVHAAHTVRLLQSTQGSTPMRHAVCAHWHCDRKESNRVDCVIKSTK